MRLERRGASPTICISIDVERDYRLDGSLSARGIEEGLPAFIDLLRSREVPFDLFVSGEICDRLPRGIHDGRTAIGCHGMRHQAGRRSYLSLMPADAQRREIAQASELIRAKIGKSPIHFRAPNFSADGTTLSILEGLGYRLDSSVMPGRHVRQWRILPLLDHRGAPLVPYHPDPLQIAREGGSAILEVPVTPNVLLTGGPLGLGFLNSAGAPDAVRAVAQTPSACIVFLAHSWEMVDWRSSDPVAPWVPTAASSRLGAFSSFLDSFSHSAFINMDEILARGPYLPKDA